MYSYGMVLWELTTRTMPWSDAHNNALIMQWVSQGDREDIPPSTPLPIATLIRKCWASDPAERPSAEQAMQVLAQSLGELEKLDSPLGGSVSSLSQAVPGSHDVVYTGDQADLRRLIPTRLYLLIFLVIKTRVRRVTWEEAVTEGIQGHFSLRRVPVKVSLWDSGLPLVLRLRVTDPPNR